MRDARAADGAACASRSRLRARGIEVETIDDEWASAAHLRPRTKRSLRSSSSSAHGCITGDIMAGRASRWAMRSHPKRARTVQFGRAARRWCDLRRFAVTTRALAADATTTSGRRRCHHRGLRRLARRGLRRRRALRRRTAAQRVPAARRPTAPRRARSRASSTCTASRRCSTSSRPRSFGFPAALVQSALALIWACRRTRHRAAAVRHHAAPRRPPWLGDRRSSALFLIAPETILTESWFFYTELQMLADRARSLFALARFAADRRTCDGLIFAG